MKISVSTPPHDLAVSSYRKFDARVDALYEAKEYDQAITLLEQMKTDFPDRLSDTYNYCFWVYVELEQFDNALGQIEQALQRGIYRPIGAKYICDKIGHVRGYAELRDKIDLAFAGTKESSEPLLDILLPKDDYTGGFILMLHGDGQSIPVLKECVSPKPYLDLGLAVAYLQSPDAHCTDGFIWTENYKASRHALSTATDELNIHYGTNDSDLIIVGYSGGAMAAMSLISHESRHFKLCLAICPSDDVGEDAVNFIGNKLPASSNLKIYKGEYEPHIDSLMKKLNKTNAAVEIRVKDMDHDIANFVDKIVTDELRLLKL